MVFKKDRLKMTQFICDRLEESDRYLIRTKDDEHIRLIQDPHRVENPASIDVICLGTKPSKAKLKQMFRANKANNVWTAAVFFRDEKMYWAKTLATVPQRDGRKFEELSRSEQKNLANYRARRDQSFKNLTEEERRAMVNIRVQEKLVKEYQGHSGNARFLCYYQPPKSITRESLRWYRPRTFTLDRSYIEPGMKGHGFVKDEQSKIYRIMEERWEQPRGQEYQGPVVLSYHQNLYKFLVLNPRPITKKEG